MERDTHFILGVYDDEDVLLHAVEKVRGSGLKIHDFIPLTLFTGWSMYWVTSEASFQLPHFFSVCWVQVWL